MAPNKATQTLRNVGKGLARNSTLRRGAAATGATGAAGGGYLAGNALSDPVQRMKDYIGNTPYGEAMQDVMSQQRDAYGRVGTDLRNAFNTARNFLRDPGYGGAVQYDLPKVMPTGAAMPMGMMSQYPAESRVPQPQNTIVPHGEFPVNASRKALWESLRHRGILPSTNVESILNRPESRVQSVDYGADPLATKVFNRRHGGTRIPAAADSAPYERRFERLREMMRARSKNNPVVR